MNLDDLPGALLALSTALVFLGIGGLLTYESWALFTNHEPITGFVRESLAGHPQLALVGSVIAAFTIGTLLGHFSWH